VEEVVDGHAEAETKRGNTLSLDGDEKNPVVKIKTGNDNSAVKKVSIRGLFPEQAQLSDSLPTKRLLKLQPKA